VKFLCLAYGSEEDWNALNADEQHALLAQDEVLRERGDYVAAVHDEVVTVRNPDGTTIRSYDPFARSYLPLAGFGIIEAESIDEAVRLVENSPCARAKGAVELRRLM
jgi:hypothetical protein